MAYTNFKALVWSESVERELEKALVYAQDCNRQYEGAVKKHGDSVRILAVGKPTITTTASGEIVLDNAEKIEDTSVLMNINQISYFNYKVDDIDRRQAVGGVMDALNRESCQALADAMDIHIANCALSSEAIKYSKTPVQLTKANILAEIDKCIEALYSNNVKPSNKVVLTLPPWMYMLLKQAYTDLDTSNSKILENGKVGRYGNVLVKMTNNVAKGENGESLVMLRTDKAIGFANPMTHTEPYRPQNGFSDAVKGFVLYQAKIVRPKELIVLNVKQ